MQIPRKIQCLERLITITGCLEGILAYLSDEKLISISDVSKVRDSSDRAAELHIVLESLRKSEKLLLLDYEWTILPVERIRVLMVTERSQQAFTHNYA